MRNIKSKKLYEKALSLFPGGVNSPVRAFKSVYGTPLFIKKGKGPFMWDADDNKYIDFCGSFGPLILGHKPKSVYKSIVKALNYGTTFGAPTEWENTLASLIIDNNRFVEKIRFVSSGTEAAMSAIRLARGYTGKNKIIKFEGCYHGHVDSLLVNAGSGLATFGTSSSAGIPEAFVKETIVLPLNDKEAVLAAVEKFRGDIACIAIEPIPANNGLLIQGKDYLQFLRDVCDKENILLFFDEVISGFRVGFEGAAGYYNVKPDVVAYGKIIGGGLPVGAYGASAEVMSKIAPDGDVYQAGTLSGNPVAMAAGIAQLSECLKENFYQKLESKTTDFCNDIMDFATKKNYEFKLIHIGSIFWISFSHNQMNKASDIQSEKMEYFKKLHKALLERGVYVGPSGYEVGFISQAHKEGTLTRAAQAFKEALEIVFEEK
jgi:glutamate-1-semialdehyde 2,1-aminomutase